MPAAPPAALEVSENPEPPVERLREVPIQTMGAFTLTMLALVEAGAETLSRGPGDGAGAGNRTGSGAEQETGPARWTVTAEIQAVRFTGLATA